MFGFDFKEILFRIPTILLAISVHEVAHGYVAYCLGDPTAKQNGRLSLNPLAHFDLIGTICMLLFGFGWARAVPVNTMYFKNRKAGMSLVGLAGPLSNFLMATLFAVIFGLCARFGLFYSDSLFASFVFEFLLVAISLNISLGVFNLIPIPPLDGSKIVAVVLPDNIYYKLMRFELYAAPFLMLILLAGILDAPLNFFTGKIWSGLLAMMSLIAGMPL